MYELPESLFCIAPNVSVGPRGNRTVIKSNDHKTPCVGLLDTKVY